MLQENYSKNLSKYKKNFEDTIGTLIYCSPEVLMNNYNVTQINLGHRKTNIAAGKLYEKLGFEIVGEDEQDYFRTKNL